MYIKEQQWYSERDICTEGYNSDTKEAVALQLGITAVLGGSRRALQ